MGEAEASEAAMNGRRFGKRAGIVEKLERIEDRRAKIEDCISKDTSTLFFFHIRRFILASALFFLISCGSKDNAGPVLARVGPRQITQAGFERRLQEMLMRAPRDNAQMREAVLRTMMDEQLLLLAAEHRGLREQEDFKRYSEAARLDAVLEAYRDALVEERVEVQENEVKQAFLLACEQAAARHLYAPTLAEANALYAQLQAGATFEELAPTVFKDYRLASNGGYLGYFKWEDMDPTFAAAAQMLKKGEISRPVRTPYGYSIIKLEDRKQGPLVTETEYAQQRKKMRWVVEHRKRAREIQKLDAETIAGLRIQFEEPVLARMWQEVQPARRDSAALIESNGPRRALAPPTVVAKAAGKEWTVQDFQERAVWTSERQRDRVQSPEDLRSFLSGLVLREEYLRQAKSEGLENDPRVQHRWRADEDKFLLKKITALLIDSVQVPADSLRQYYEAEPQNHMQPAQVLLREITVTSQEQAHHLLQQLRSGAGFAELAKRYSVRQWTGKHGGEVGYLTKDDLGDLADEIFKLKKGGLGGPYRQGDYFVLVQVLEALPRRPKTFAEATAEIEQVLLPLFRQRALQESLKELRRPLDITIDQEVLQKIKSPLLSY